jgi:hypothetical protein
MIIQQDFIDLGYKKCQAGIESYWASVMFQKDFRDPAGIKYYINVYFSIDGDKPTAKVQFNSATGSTVNVEMWNFPDIISMENHFEYMWANMGYEYYEAQ